MQENTKDLKNLWEVVNALCIFNKGWIFYNEKILFDSASEIITKRAEYLQLLNEKKLIEDKMEKYFPNQKKLPMTPKEKAKELIDKFMPHSSGNSNNNEAKQCALISVDEMICVLTDLNGIYNITPALTYWQEVRQEMAKI